MHIRQAAGREVARRARATAAREWESCQLAHKWRRHCGSSSLQYDLFHKRLDA